MFRSFVPEAEVLEHLFLSYEKLMHIKYAQRNMVEFINSAKKNIIYIFNNNVLYRFNKDFS